ncbi:alpha/beta hydrolase [Mangrovimonas spongiae]|uniref:Alpha/beta hydrolase n=1 Tax=Mangrovimonas spongiae TaxID=2494697 RepID=A0A3R9MEN3_9FLAO|nr:alpha/beta hydrolase [Mangrovimonas spongiae]RSK40299.1 alpha/beta hydrolase [Mangrovimonas spongiae]
MKITKNILLTISIISVLLSCSIDENNSQNATFPQSLDYREELDLPYGNDSEQTFDIFLPADRNFNTKTLLLVHGGGWSSGDKSDMNAFRDYLRTHFPDIAIVNINYRLANENTSPHPMQMNDLTSVITHLVNNQNNYIIDDEFGFIGVSAGAHLSMLWSYAYDTNNLISMVANIVGPTNFTDEVYLNNNNPELQELLNLYGVDATTGYLQEVSPYHQVTEIAPPTILFYGGQDPLVPTSQGTAMRDKLEALNVIHEFTLYENEAHGWTGTNLLDTMNKLSTFIDTHL